ncbi:ABC transporter ATP-binding protein [Pedobacter sp. SYSU D00535]|uniref:ABC transporter ATP-binding protein n=1 Tax=Pedobacter sp. SYSU D00535 TaxID=2810308 RepID=UPI001A95A3C2|nr:ABC transporter ATP-binding protein [Pedobacter sp. SYSU D00535]
MKILLENIGRRFNREWIFKNLNYTFETGESYAILGRNGSGKSTLLQIIAGSLTPSEGRITYLQDSKKLDPDYVFPNLSIAAPYLDLVEEFTLTELINFHFKFKRFYAHFDTPAVIKLLGLGSSRHKPLKYFSSGMKQRTKLALAFCSDTSVLLLDEPTANLDSQGIAWYRSCIETFSERRLVIICSNQEHEYDFCQAQLNILDYK